MTAEDLIELRDYAKSMGFCVFERWDAGEFTISIPHHKEFDRLNWIINCTYTNKSKIDIILKDKLENYMETGSIENYKTYRVKYLNLDTMKRWLDLMLIISKQHKMKQKLKNIEKDFV